MEGPRLFGLLLGSAEPVVFRFSMDESGLRDTIAYRIVRQILDHVYPDQKMTNPEFMSIFRTFSDVGGSWEDLIVGSPKSYEMLMDVLKAFVKVKNTIR